MIKQGIKMGAKALGSYFITAVLSLMVCANLSQKLLWLQLLINAILLGMMGLMMYAAGGSEGEKACTLTATIKRMETEGKTVDSKLRERQFDKRVAVAAFLACALPLLIMAGVNLAVEPYYPPVIADPNAPDIEELSQQYQEMTDEEKAAFEEELKSEEHATNWVNVAARFVNMPYVSTYSLLWEHPHTLNLLFLLYAVISALPTPVGYLMGPRLRKKKLIDIEKGKKRKMKKLRVHQKPKQPKMEV